MIGNNFYNTLLGSSEQKLTAECRALTKSTISRKETCLDPLY